MEKRKETEKKCNRALGKKWKRVIAVALSVLMVTSVIDYSGFINVNAQTNSDIKTITTFTELPEDICNQQIAEGTSEADINLPDTLNVTVRSFVQENVDAVVESTEDTTLENIAWRINALPGTSDIFDSTSAGAVYIYEPVLPEGYSAAEGISLPQIKVEIREKEENNGTFQEGKAIDGIEIMVKADAGVFPEGALLNIRKIVDANEQGKIEEAVKEEVGTEEEAKTVEELISFDITITDTDGNELQPDTSKGEVKVSFAQLPMVTEDAAPTQELKVFHMDDSLSEAEGLETTVNQEAATLEAPAEHFSVYTVAELTDDIKAKVEAEIKAADGTLTYYDTIEEAITVAQSLSGSTVTLLKDVATEDAVNITSGTVILDLNGKAWTNTFSVGSGVLQLVGSSGNTASLTVKDSAGGGSITTTDSGVYSIFGYTDYSLSLEGGSYTGIWARGSEVGNVLADGYAYKNNESGEWITDMSVNKISNVTVAEAPIEMMSVSVTEAGGTVHNYVTIEKAITAAQSMSGSTLKLLKDVATTSALTTINGNLIIDLNGKTWSAYQLTINTGSNVSIEDSAGGGTITATSNYVIFALGTLTLKGGTFIGGTNASIFTYEGTIADLLADGYVYQNSESGATITDMSDCEISNVTVRAIPVKITAQPEDTLAASGYSEAPTFNVTAETIPADSGETITYQWYKDSAAMSGATSASYTAETGLADGTYTYYCAVTCDGYTVNSDNATLYVTSAEGNYEVTSSGGLTFKYPTLETAITAAKSKPNSTVKLLADATTADTVEVSSGTFTIDLNGHTWTAAKTALLLKSGSNVTLKDSAANGILQSPAYGVIVVKASSYTEPVILNIESGSYKCQNTGMGNVIYSSNMLDIPKNIATINISGGEFSLDKPVSSWCAYFENATVNISGGKFLASTYFNEVNAQLSGGEFVSISNSGGIVAALLKAGYGFRTIDSRSGAADNQWVNQIEGAASHVNDLAHTSLTYMTRVEKLPLEIKNQPVNPANAVYGYTSAPQASMFAERTDAAPEGSTITYQWYRVKSGDETSDTALGTSATQTLPTGLDTGTHSFYCVVTCDGYILNSESATFTVEKATPTVALQVFTKNSDPFEYGKEVFFTAVVTGVDDETPDGTVTFKIGSGTIDTADYDNSSKNYTLSNGQFFDAGTYSFTAVYTPSADGTGKNYVGATSAAVEQTIDKATPNITLEIKGAGADDEIVYGSAVTYTVRVTGVDGVALTDATIVNANCVDGGNPVGYVMEYNTEKGAYFISQANFNNARPGTYPFYAIAVFPEGSDTDNNYVLGEDNEILSASISKTVQKADTSIAFNSSYTGNFYYTGSPVSNPAAADLSITGASYSNVTFVWYDSSNQLDTPPTAPGSYTLEVSIPENDYFKPSSNTKSVTIGFYDGTVTPAYNGSTTKAGWYTGDVQISADGYTVSDSADGTFASSYLLSGEGEVSKTLYFKQDGTGYITDGKSVSVSIDKTAPAFSADTDGITISDNNWKGFLNNITFGHFFKENKDVSISATDSGSGVSKYYYYIDTTGSMTLKTAEELNSISFTDGSSFSITDENKYIIYAYTVDQTGNKSTYICTDGIVLDKTAPTLTLTAPAGSDIGDVSATATVQMNETGTVHYVIKTAEQADITAQNILDSTEKNMVSVTDDQADTNLDVALSGLTANTTYYIYAVGTDRAGNNSEVKSTSFTTTKPQPLFTSDPTITGTYGQQVKDMTVSQVPSTNGIAGSWSVSSTDIPSVGTSTSYGVVFTPDDAASYATVTVPVIPTITRKSLTADGVAIGEVTDVYTYDQTAKEPTVTIADSMAIITASDYDYSYSDNIGAGKATLTITGKGNYTGTVNRTFMIAKAATPSIDFPTADSIIYGQKLSDSTFSQSSNQYGTFAWTNGNTVPTVANSGYEVTFTPNAGAVANYESITNTTKMVAITVSKATPAVTVEAAVSGDVGNRNAKLTVTVNGVGDGEVPTGTVTFINTTNGSDEDLAEATEVTIIDGKAVYTWAGLENQIYKVKAVYSGNGNYNTAASSELSFDTTKQNQEVLTIESIGTKTYGDEAFTLSTTGGSGNGTVSFTSSDPDIISISGTVATIHKAGTVTITATKATDDTYNEASASVTLTIGKKALIVKAEDKLNVLAGSAMPQLTYSVNGLVGSDTFANPTLTTKAVDMNTVGEFAISISGGTLTNADSYTVAYANGKMTIVRIGVADAVVSGIKSMNYNKKAIVQPGLSVQLNGKILTYGTDYEVTYKNNTNIGTATVIITGKGTYTGTIEKSFQIKVSKGASYTISNMKYKVTNAKVNGTGTVTLTGSTKSKSGLMGTLKIGDSVKIGGISFKITAIGDKAFKGYTKLTKVTIGKNVTTIGKEVFSGCSKVTSVTIGAGLRTISTNAFYNCKKLKTVTISSKNVKTVSKNSIKNIYSKCVIKVPSSKVSAYKKVFKSNTGFANGMKLKKI